MLNANRCRCILSGCEIMQPANNVPHSMYLCVCVRICGNFHIRMIFEYILYALQGEGNSVVRAVGSPGNVAEIVF